MSSNAFGLVLIAAILGIWGFVMAGTAAFMYSQIENRVEALEKP